MLMVSIWSKMTYYPGHVNVSHDVKIFDELATYLDSELSQAGILQVKTIKIYKTIR